MKADSKYENRWKGKAISPVPGRQNHPCLSLIPAWSTETVLRVSGLQIETLY